jgi:hypothetical protein
MKKTYIYESPDRGNTVYRREFGAPIKTRELIKSNEDNKCTGRITKDT